MYVSIFGLGYVGCVSLGCLAQNGHHVIGVDVNPIKVDQINSGKPTIIEKDLDDILMEQYKAGRIKATQDFNQAILDTEISIIAVGTPSNETGHLNMKYIFQVAEQFGNILREKNDFHTIAIRSTINPAACEKFESIVSELSGKQVNEDFAVISNPEFLREGTAVSDYFNPPYTLIGSDDKFAAEKLGSLYNSLPAEIIYVERRIAEMIKFVNNSFHALKISFANEIGNLCHALGVDSHKLMQIFSKDTILNISTAYLKPGFAYGGSCLPKDLKALQTLGHDHYLKMPIMEQIDKSNQLQIERVISSIIKTKKKKLGFLGLSFKAGTDDLRYSPAVTVIETLLGKGFQIKIFDRNVSLSRLTGTNKEYIDYHIPHLASLLINSIDELLDFSEMIIVATNEKEYREFLLNTKDKMIFDLVRLGDDFLKKKNYYGINW